jgi:peptide/nickel transport system substrate-binding protein
VTKDPRIRQAVGAALNVQTINERAVAGAGQASNQLVQKGFKFYPDVPGPKYDPEAAKKLVSQVKAEGWDGKIRVLAGNNPEGQGIGLSVQTMLQAVGMDPQVEYVDTATNTQRVFIDKNYDIATHGMAITPDDGGSLNLLQNFDTNSASNRTGYSNPAVDKAIKDLRSAKTDADRTALYKTISENVAKDVPIVPMWNAEYTIAWNAKVHGFVTTSRINVLLDQVWMEK